MATRRRRWPGCLLFIVAVVAFAVGAPLWLPYIGTLLESAGSPHQADIAVVLAGDFFGNRILKAAEIARAGYVPKVLVSGPSGDYGLHESDLAIPLAVRHGFPAALFIAASNDCRSTRDEAAVLTGVLQRLGVHKFILVTSDFHTRRAAGLFRAAAPGMEMQVVSAPDAEFRLDRWWDTREGRKQVVLEWSKTVATWLGL